MKHQAFLAVCALLPADFSVRLLPSRLRRPPAENADPAPVTDEKQERDDPEEERTHLLPQLLKRKRIPSRVPNRKKRIKKRTKKTRKRRTSRMTLLPMLYRAAINCSTAVLKSPSTSRSPIFYNPLAYNMTLTIPDQPTFQGYIFYDTSEQSMSQLGGHRQEQLEDSYKQRPHHRKHDQRGG